jgi:hypothetical protein
VVCSDFGGTETSFSIDFRTSFGSFIVTSTSSSSLSIEVATILRSPDDSEPDVRTTSGSTLSAILSLVSSSSSELNSGYVVKVATFSRIFLRIMSSLLACQKSIYIIVEERDCSPHPW